MVLAEGGLEVGEGQHHGEARVIACGGGGRALVRRSEGDAGEGEETDRDNGEENHQHQAHHESKAAWMAFFKVRWSWMIHRRWDFLGVSGNDLGSSSGRFGNYDVICGVGMSSGCSHSPTKWGGGCVTSMMVIHGRQLNRPVERFYQWRLPLEFRDAEGTWKRNHVPPLDFAGLEAKEYQVSSAPSAANQGQHSEASHDCNSGLWDDDHSQASVLKIGGFTSAKGEGIEQAEV